MSGSRKGIASCPAVQDGTGGPPRIRLKHSPALSRSTAAAALGSTSCGRDAGSGRVSGGALAAHHDVVLPNCSRSGSGISMALSGACSREKRNSLKKQAENVRPQYLSPSQIPLSADSVLRPPARMAVCSGACCFDDRRLKRSSSSIAQMKGEFVSTDIVSV